MIEKLVHIYKSFKFSKSFLEQSNLLLLFKTFKLTEPFLDFRGLKAAVSMQDVKSCEGQDFVEVKGVVEVKVESRSEFTDVPSLDAAVVPLDIRCKMSQSVKVVSSE